MDTAAFLIEREATGERFALLKRKDREGKVDVVAVAGPVDRAVIEDDGKLLKDWFTQIQDTHEFKYDEAEIRKVVGKVYKNAAMVKDPPLGAHFDVYMERVNRAQASLAAFGWDIDELDDDIGPPPGGRI